MRSKWKGPFLKYIWLKKTSKKINKISIWKKSSMVLPKMWKKQIFVHDGLKYFKIKITKKMIGINLGRAIKIKNKKSLPKKKK
jgi:ribosomal protein S19